MSKKRGDKGIEGLYNARRKFFFKSDVLKAKIHPGVKASY